MAIESCYHAVPVESHAIDHCNHPHQVETEEGFVCDTCGLVLAPKYDIHTIPSIMHTEPVMSRLSYRTTFDVDNVLHPLTPKNYVKYTRLLQFHRRQYQSPIERNDVLFWIYVQQHLSQIHLPYYLLKTAHHLFLQSVKARCLCGNMVKTAIAVSIYLATKPFTQFLFSIEDICHTFLVTKVDWSTMMNAFSRNHIYKSAPLRITRYLAAIQNQLPLSEPVATKALTILTNTAKNRFLISGYKPSGFAAAAVYLAAKIYHEDVKEETVSNIAGITTITLRSRIRLLRQYVVTDPIPMRKSPQKIGVKA